MSGWLPKFLVFWLVSVIGLNDFKEYPHVPLLLLSLVPTILAVGCVDFVQRSSGSSESAGELRGGGYCIWIPPQCGDQKRYYNLDVGEQQRGSVG